MATVGLNLAHLAPNVKQLGYWQTVNRIICFYKVEVKFESFSWGKKKNFHMSFKNACWTNEW